MFKQHFNARIDYHLFSRSEMKSRSKGAFSDPYKLFEATNSAQRWRKNCITIARNSKR